MLDFSNAYNLNSLKNFTPTQIAAFLIGAIIVGLVLTGILINTNLMGDGDSGNNEEVSEQDGTPLSIEGFKPFIPRTFKFLVETDTDTQAINLKEFSVSSENVYYDKRIHMPSKYQVVYKDARYRVINTYFVDINEAIYAHPGPGEAAGGAVTIPKLLPTHIYVPFDKNAASLSLMKGDRLVFDVPVPSYPETVEETVVTVSQAAPIKIAIISDGYTDMEDFRRDANVMISGMSTPPFGDVSSWFEFVIYENTTPTSCLNGVVACFGSGSSLWNVIAAANSATGAVQNIILLNGGDISAASMGGPAVIRTNTGDADMIWRAKHEFLGHSIGRLHDRYFNMGASYASYDKLVLGPSNCSENPNGEAWWSQAGGAGSFSGCAASSKFYAPFEPNCGNTGRGDTIMGLCGGQGFDVLEQYWINSQILPSLNGQAPQYLPPTNNTGSGNQGGQGGQGTTGTPSPTNPPSNQGGNAPGASGPVSYTITSGMADNLDYPGGDLQAGYDSSSPQSCQADCQNNASCFAWTWVAATGKCWQKDGSHGMCHYSSKMVSGAKLTDINNQCPIGPHGSGGPVPGAPN